MYFVDTSALVKAYVRETGTETVQDALRLLDGSVCISSIVAIETAAALARLRRTRQIRLKTYRQARSDLLNHCRTRFYVVHPPAHVADATLGLVDSYHERSAGGADLLHVATAEYLQSLIAETVSLICCDTALQKIAKERGFRIFDPLSDSLSDLLPPAPPAGTSS